jgi:hypothetical protein
VSVRVSNTGSVAAGHVVMLFLFDIYRRVTPEYKLLRRFLFHPYVNRTYLDEFLTCISFRFERVFLNPAASQVVSFNLSSADFEYFGVDGWYAMCVVVLTMMKIRLAYAF